MTEASGPSPKPQPKPRRGWFRRALRWLGVLLLLAAIFHRPLFHNGVRLVLIRVAARQNLDLDVRFSGSIFTNLTVENVRAVPTGDGPSPVEKIAIERVRLDYSLAELAKHGIGEFLRSYEISNAELVFVARESKTDRERRQKRTLAEDLNNLLAQPAAYADRVKIENFNIVVKSAKDGETAVRGIHLLLDPYQAGHLRIARVQVPKMPVWENLSAETSYAGRNFFIKRLELAPELVLEEVNFDASQRAQDKGSMMVKAQAFGGTAHLTLAGSQLDQKGRDAAKAYDTTLRIEAAGISVGRLAQYFNLRGVPPMQLARLSLLHTGDPERPRTWKGNATARVEALSLVDGKMNFEAVEAATIFADGRAQVTAGNVTSGKNKLAFTANAELPESVTGFVSSVVDAELKIDAGDITRFTAMVPEPIGGSATGGGKVSLRNRRATADIALAGENVGNKQYGVGAIKLHVQGSKQLDPVKGKPLAGLDGKVTADLNGLRFETFNADTARIDGEIHDEHVTLRTLDIARAENSVSVHGIYRIPVGGARDHAGQASRSTPQQIEGEFTIKAPRLEAFGIPVKDKILSGHIEGNGSSKFVNNALTGSIRLDGGDFQLGEFKAEKLAAKIDIANNEASIEQFTLLINDTDQVAATGKLGLKAPLTYEGAALVTVQDLAAFQPLLEVFGVKEPIAGALEIDLSGKTEAAPQPAPAGTLAHSGELSVELTKARYGKIEISEFKLAGIYGAGFAQSSEFRIASGPTKLRGAIEIKESRLRVRDIAVEQGELTVLTGFILLPLDLENLKAPIPLEKRVAANVNARDLDIEQLLASFGQAAPASGTITANLVTGGTLLAPTAHLKVAGRNLKAKATPQLEPGEIDLTAHYSQKELTLDAAVRQPQIQQLTIKGRAPFDLDATVQQKKIDPNLPLELDVTLPESSLAIVPKVTPQVRRIEGTAAIEAHVRGSVEKPILSGAAAVKVQSARLADEQVPAIGGFQADLAFAEDTLSVKTFRGEIGGGSIDLGGKVELVKFTEPVFDLHLRSDEVLVKRDDSITVRVDTDVKLAGPLNAAAVTGEVFVTHSRFFREIDILPIGLPGRPKPKPREVPSGGSKAISFDEPPLRDWTFDVAIKTRPDDPFRIRGNLANGGAAIDLKFAGTGLQPYLDGNVQIENLTASLPFSKLQVTRGFVYFKPEEPFEPSLDIAAESSLRDYQVNALIYGKASDPQVSLTSEPPLPQAEIVSLLATGTTTGELTGKADVLAGRAAVLVFQQLYRKIFKKKEPSEEESLLDRFELEMGSVDSRSGKQEVTARFKLGDQFYLIGELDVTGNFTGRLKYLLRFR